MTVMVNTLFTVIRYEMFFVILALALIVAYRLLLGQIKTGGLLQDKITHEFSPERLQMLITTMLDAVGLAVVLLIEKVRYGTRCTYNVHTHRQSSRRAVLGMRRLT